MISVIRIALYHCQMTVFIFEKATYMCGTVKYVGLLNVAAITVLLTNFVGQRTRVAQQIKKKSCLRQNLNVYNHAHRSRHCSLY